MPRRDRRSINARVARTGVRLLGSGGVLPPADPIRRMDVEAPAPTHQPFNPAECDRPEGHEWQLLTRHPDPPGQHGVLPNAICVHCSEQTWFDLEADDGD